MKAFIGEIVRNAGHWLRAKKIKLAAIIFIAALIVPPAAEGQFLPSPCCAILSAGLGSVASAITNVIGSSLNAINSTMSSIEAFQRTIVWPQNLINQAKAAVGSLQVIFQPNSRTRAGSALQALHFRPRNSLSRRCCPEAPALSTPSVRSTQQSTLPFRLLLMPHPKYEI